MDISNDLFLAIDSSANFPRWLLRINSSEFISYSFFSFSSMLIYLGTSLSERAFKW